MNEYDATWQQAVLFDLSEYGKIELSGKDAGGFLHNLCTNDIKNLPVGGGCEAFLCNARARTLAHVFVGRFLSPLVPQGSGEAFLLDMIPSLTDKVYQHLDKFHISEEVEIVKRTAELGMLRLAGPRARGILDKVFEGALPDLPLLHHISRETPLTGRCHLRRQDLLSLPGFDVFCDRQKLGPVREALLGAGAVAAGPEVHEILRVEAGTPVYGQDMDDNRFVAELGRTERAISYSKGCYLGQEPIVMARDRGQVNRTLLGIKVSSGEALLPGVRLFQGETEVGQTTSSVRSPRLGMVIALAYLKRGAQEAGTELVVEPPTDGRKAVVASLPFAAVG